MNILDQVPVWADGVAIFMLLIVATQLGGLLRARRAQASGEDETYVLSAAVGLLGLLIGFTFSLALSRYEQRRELVLQEANAIGTLYLRADLTPQPFRGQLQALERSYVDARLALARAGEDPAAITRAERDAETLQGRLWRTAMAAVPQITPPITASLLVASLNDTIDLAASRKAALSARLPASVLAVLIVYAAISAAIVGYVVGGTGGRPRISAVILFALTTLAITLILDLDRPRTGSIVVSQAPLVDLKQSIAGP
jgi:hypothetical protein